MIDWAMDEEISDNKAANPDGDGDKMIFKEQDVSDKVDMILIVVYFLKDKTTDRANV